MSFVALTCMYPPFFFKNLRQYYEESYAAASLILRRIP